MGIPLTNTVKAKDTEIRQRDLSLLSDSDIGYKDHNDLVANNKKTRGSKETCI